MNKLNVELLREEKEALINDKLVEYVEYSLIVNSVKIYVKGADKTSKGALDLVFESQKK